MRKTWILMVCGLLVAGVAMAQSETKESDPPVTGGQFGPGTGGPDGFGYTYADQTAGCNGVVVDISATGTPVVSGDDTSSGPLAIGGPGVDFYGTVYNTLVMASNGYISTDPTDTGPDLSNDCPLPNPPSTGGGARMYPLHDDLITGQGYHQYMDPCPVAGRFPNLDACNVFFYDDVSHFGGGGPWEQSVYVYDNYDITVAVGPGNPEAGSGSTTGIQNDGATIGLTYACDTGASIPDNTGVCFEHPAAVPVELLGAEIE